MLSWTANPANAAEAQWPRRRFWLLHLIPQVPAWTPTRRYMTWPTGSQLIKRGKKRASGSASAGLEADCPDP